MSYEASKKSLAAYKGHYGIVYKSFTSLLALQPQPTEEAVNKSYTKLQERIDKLIKAVDDNLVVLVGEDHKDATFDVEKERMELMSFYEKLLFEQNEIEGKFVEFKEKCQSKYHVPTEKYVSPTEHKAPVRLTALSPPAWNGVKADFYTWKRKFIHIMSEAKMCDELTQLCYLQNPQTLPIEYQALISDCPSLTEVWSRLEERVPKETIQYEIIAQFRNIKSLPSKRSPKMLRDFANEISMFCRRMADLGLQKHNYSCIVMQDVYERIDFNTALRYRSKIELKKELGARAEEDLESISAFLRSEATSLELSMGDTSQIGAARQGISKFTNVMSVDERVETLAQKSKCPLGCEEIHRFVDCKEYMGMTSGERKEFIKNCSRCFICLGNYHTSWNCSRKRGNRKCGSCSETNHHWTLCHKNDEGVKALNPRAPHFSQCADTSKLNEKKGENEDKQLYSAMAHNDSISAPQKEVNVNSYAPLVLAEVKTGNGSWSTIKCFLDTGSNASLIRLNFAKMNKLHSNGTCTVKFGIAGGGVHQEKAEVFELQIRSLGGKESHMIVATGIKKPCSNVPPISEDVFKNHKHLKDARAKIFLDGGEVDLLLGVDYAPLILPENLLRAPSYPDDSPSVASTRVGCYIYGTLGKRYEETRKDVLSVNYINQWEENEMKMFFYGDVLGVKPTSICLCPDNQVAEAAFIKHVQKTTRVDESGRVCVRMPWKPGYPESLPNNYKKAREQLVRRERQLIRDNKLEQYNNEVEKLVERGVVKILSEEQARCAQDESAWYLNHRMIERPDKTTSKLRLVFDSAAPFMGVSLNDAFEKGPVYTNSLFRCLLGWRKDIIAVSGDIEKMFNQVSMSEEDQKYHRFLWRYGDESLAITVYQWLRVLFGDKPSPDLATFALRFLANKFKTENPRGASILEEETYVDDIVFCEGNNSKAIKAITEVDVILTGGNFKVKTWNSNKLEVDQNKEERIVDVLGHVWDKDTDSISMKPKDISIDDQDGFTKRSIMSVVAKLWDPYGYLLPITIQYRIDLQKIWQKGYSWDEILPSEVADSWKVHLNQMQMLKEIRIERCLKPEGVIGSPQIHAFSDGGNDAYGTCVYLRWKTSEGTQVKFVAAKAFVAPLKYKTTPRLELMGALAMSRVTTGVEEALGCQIEYKRFWIDSEIVIYWLLSESNRYKPFISTRIQEFQDSHPNWKEEVKYVSSENNPADCLTKSIPIEKLGAWHEGRFCQFLESNEESLIQNPNLETINTESIKDVLEEKVVTTSKRRGKSKILKKLTKVSTDRMMPTKSSCSTAILSVTEGTKNEEKFGYEVAAQFSSWSKLISAIAFLQRSFNSRSFKGNLDNAPNDTIKAENRAFYIAQEELRTNLEHTRRRFIKFNPVYEEDGIIRARGRLENIDIDEVAKRPILLPGEHPLVRIFLVYHHRKLLHQGYRVIIANLMNLGYFIGGGKDHLKNIASRCIFCRIRRRKVLQQMMGNIPSFRIQVRKPPFTSVAIDFFGPLKVKQSRNVAVNGSVMIVTCTTTRCIHLELCLLMDTNSFLRAWRRFIATRGVHPVHVFSDGGTNFVGAHSVIREWIQSWNQHLIQQEFPLTMFDFEWEFNIPTASHMNGVVESLVNSVRKGLDAAITNYTRSKLTYEEWTTVLTEVTYVVNSRPLFPEGDPWEFNCITGNQILHPYGQPQVPQIMTEERYNLKDMLKVAENRVDTFWNTWIKHMPPQLLSRDKWFHPRDNLEVGDFVLVLEKGLKCHQAARSLWKKAIVIATHPGADGLVRSVTIRDSNRHEYKRPIHKLCLIATHSELEADE